MRLRDGRVHRYTRNKADGHPCAAQPSSPAVPPAVLPPASGCPAAAPALHGGANVVERDQKERGVQIGLTQGFPWAFPAENRPAAWFWLLRTIRPELQHVRAELHAAAIVFLARRKKATTGWTPAAGLSHPSIKFVMIHSYHRSSRKASHDRRRDRHVTATCANVLPHGRMPHFPLLKTSDQGHSPKTNCTGQVRHTCQQSDVKEWIRLRLEAECGTGAVCFISVACNKKSIKNAALMEYYGQGRGYENTVWQSLTENCCSPLFFHVARQPSSYRACRHNRKTSLPGATSITGWLTSAASPHDRSTGGRAGGPCQCPLNTPQSGWAGGAAAAVRLRCSHKQLGGQSVG